MGNQKVYFYRYDGEVAGTRCQVVKLKMSTSGPGKAFKAYVEPEKLVESARWFLSALNEFATTGSIAMDDAPCEYESEYIRGGRTTNGMVYIAGPALSYVSVNRAPVRRCLKNLTPESLQKIVTNLCNLKESK